MGIEKVGLNMAKEIIAWARTSSRKSLLAMRPVKVNIAELKYAPILTEDVVQISHSLGNFSQKTVEILKDGTKKLTGQLKWQTKDGKVKGNTIVVKTALTYYIM